MRRREYAISITVNDKQISKVIIDPHYELKHAESVTDEIILQLVRRLDGEVFVPVKEDVPFSYFVYDKINLNGKIIAWCGC